MKIVVNHLTRMEPGYICVAGIDPETMKHVRPVLPGRERLAVGLLAREGGVFDNGTLVDLGATRSRPTPPETEDHLFDPDSLVAERDLAPRRFWKLLESVSQSTLAAIFGNELTARRSGCTIDEGLGIASLGCVRPAVRPELEINRWGKLRVRISDGVFDVDLSVTDLRLYEDDQQTPRAAAVADIQQRIGKGVGVILSVGVARAFVAKGDTARRHWLQVNSLHLEDNPTWKVT